MIDQLVNNSYIKYIGFLKENKNARDTDDVTDVETRLMKNIVKHACYWKGARNAPKNVHVKSLLRLLGIRFTNDAGKLDHLQKLIANLRGIIGDQLPRWSEPIPKTAAAKLLFSFTSDPVVYTPAIPGIATPGPPPVVGVRKFANVEEFAEFMELGQHPTNASPCVPTRKVDWAYPMVYEEWSQHHITLTGRSIIGL